MPKLHISSLKDGYSRVKIKEKCKVIEWLDGNDVTEVGVMAKTGCGDWLEWRVLYSRPLYPVTNRASAYNNNPRCQPHAEQPDTEKTYILMECFNDLKDAKAYVKKHFESPETLKKEMFNVYLKMLHPLG